MICKLGRYKNPDFFLGFSKANEILRKFLENFSILMFRKILLLCHMKSQTLLSSYCRYRLFEG